MKKFLALLAAVVVATIAFALAAGTAVAAPPDTTPVTADEEIGNVCWLTGQNGAFLPEGEWELTPTESVGTHSISGMWCGPIGESVTPEVVIPPVENQPLSPEAVEQGDTYASSAPMLPSTGAVTDGVVIVAVILLAVGALIYIASRFNRY